MSSRLETLRCQADKARNSGKKKQYLALREKVEAEIARTYKGRYVELEDGGPHSPDYEVIEK